MENYTISEYFTLPSKGLVYGKKVASEIHMSSMTTRHEMQRLAPSKSQFKVLFTVQFNNIHFNFTVKHEEDANFPNKYV